MKDGGKIIVFIPRRFGSRVHLHPDEQYPKNLNVLIKLKFFVDDHVGVANMLVKFHAERSSGVSSVKKINFGDILG